MAEHIRVLSPGLLTTVQDLGRFGHAHIGVSASGAADAFSARIANRLVGNSENAPLLEMTLLGGEFEFGCDRVVALAGSDFAATLNRIPVPMYESLQVHAGAVLSCGSTKTGARCYLAIGGGIDVTPVLGSASTHLLSGIGGFRGRALRQGDILPLKTTVAQRSLKFDLSALDRLNPASTLRVTYGPQQHYFSDEANRGFYSQTYTVSEESNRLGLRLRGPKIDAIPKQTLLTEGASLGAVQIPPAGEPIILFVEHQTTGGYPKIANVISADMHVVGQLRPRDQVRFELVSMNEAIAVLKQQEEKLNDALLPQ